MYLGSRGGASCVNFYGKNLPPVILDPLKSIITLDEPCTVEKAIGACEQLIGNVQGIAHQNEGVFYEGQSSSVKEEQALMALKDGGDCPYQQGGVWRTPYEPTVPELVETPPGGQPSDSPAPTNSSHADFLSSCPNGAGVWSNYYGENATLQDYNSKNCGPNFAKPCITAGALGTCKSPAVSASALPKGVTAEQVYYASSMIADVAAAADMCTLYQGTWVEDYEP